MSRSISDELLSQVADVVAAQMGLHFPPDRWVDLERGIDNAARELQFKDLQSCMRWLLSSPLTKKQIETLAVHLTVGETYFFREKGTFELIQEHVLVPLIGLRRGTERRLRIWSAACCTGEEPYSIAIVLNQIIPDLDTWNITIIGTDINPVFVQRARAGLYHDWSFRATPRWIKQKYFKASTDGNLEILPCIKRMVSFSCLNLAEDVFPSLLNNTNAMDVILCRNVLIYFAPEQATRVVSKLHRSLVDRGCLIVSPSETSEALFSEFRTIVCPELTLYQKSSDPLKSASSCISPSQPESSLLLVPEAKPEMNVLPRMDERRTSETEGSSKIEERYSIYGEALKLYEQGQYAEASQRLLTSLSQRHDDAQGMALLARIYANQGNLAEALAWCDRSIAVDKLNAATHYLRSIILQEQAQFEEATASLKKSLYLNQNFVLAHFALGNLSLKQGKGKVAAKHLKNALSLLKAHPPEEILPESEGITAARLTEIIRSIETGEAST